MHNVDILDCDLSYLTEVYEDVVDAICIDTESSRQTNSVQVYPGVLIWDDTQAKLLFCCNLQCSASTQTTTL